MNHKLHWSKNGEIAYYRFKSHALCNKINFHYMSLMHKPLFSFIFNSCDCVKVVYKIYEG